MAWQSRLGRRHRIVVLAGGDSAERVVSLDSGAAVAEALRQAGHFVLPVDPAVTRLADVAWSEFDCAFLALHGTWGEDGEVQSLLDGLGVPYTGSDAAASRLAFQKSAAKERFAQCGVPTPDSVVIHESDEAPRVERLAKRVGYPLVVKPDAQGSSLGVCPIDSPEALPEALANCFRFGPFGLLERMVIGTEWTVGLLDDLVLPPIQIVTPRPFYDYEAKYHDDRTEYLFDASPAPSVLREIESAGFHAGRAIGTSGLARVDLRLDEEGRPWVLEVNTIPGMTSHSLIPKAAARVGIPFADLCERSVETALSRSGRRMRRVG